MSSSTPVTLTSVKNPADKRYLIIYHGESTLIGRASKSESKNLQPYATNALFDCPVISREHAELKVNKFASAGEQITITDKGSMHGTHVNGRKLERFVPFTLRSGDLLQFGTRVTRGPDTHDGVYVTFDRDIAKPTPSTFMVPDGSEDELSDEEENSSASHMSDEEDEEVQVSSAKTTPEQAKSQPGSAQQPIDLTSMPPPPPPRPNFINLVDDARDDTFYPLLYRPQSPVYPPRRNLDSVKYKLGDDDDYEPSQNLYPALPKTSLTKTVDLIQDSIDKDAEVPVPESIPLNRIDSLGDDDESVLDHNTGLTGLLSKHDYEPSERDEDEAESEAEARLEDLDEEEEEDEEDNEEADRLSESDASDLYGDGDLLDEDFEELNSYSAKKHVSPELTSALPNKSATSTQAPFKIGSQWTSGIPVKPATQPYYDPVRASHVGGAGFEKNIGSSTHALPPKVSSAPLTQAYRPYTYAPPTHILPAYNGYVYPFTDASSSSRWDMPPSTSFNATYPSYISAPLRGPTYSRDHGLSNMYANHEPASYNPENAFKYFEEMLETDVRKSLDGVGKQIAVGPAEAKKSMKISDMVEKAADAVKDAVNGAEETILAGGKKRKVDEMKEGESTSPVVAVAEQAAGIEEAMEDIRRNDAVDHVQEPPAQRRRIEQPAHNTTARNVAGGIAKYATAAAVGGAGTMAFLCSPLMERLLEWMA